MAVRIGGTTVYRGNCLDVMSTLAMLGTQVDSIVTDPPYHLTTVKRFGSPDAAPAQHGTDGLYQRASKGFMGKEWDGGNVAFQVETWRRCYDLLKPGGHLFAFSGARTYHRMACAIEDAGFEIRNQFLWLYGTGFPKSHNVSKAIDKRAQGQFNAQTVGTGGYGCQAEYDLTAPATDEARQWDGWGTDVKPAHEPIVLTRKPLAEPSVAENVLRYGTGAINIDACRVGTDGGSVTVVGDRHNTTVHAYGDGLDAQGGKIERPEGLGRFPANVIHDGSDEVLAGLKAHRFFYSAKASKADRAGSKHPTVKPVDLIRWLATMITPPGGTCLDPFAGSGTLGAAWPNCILIEREAEYFVDIIGRLTQCAA